MTTWRLIKESTGDVVVSALEVADTFLARLAGLQFRRSLPPGCGLLLVPCSSVHTHWMRFPIDVVMLDRLGKVLSVHRSIAPWKFLGGEPETHAVLECPANSAGVEPGDRLRLMQLPGRQPVSARSLEFLLPS